MYFDQQIQLGMDLLSQGHIKEADEIFYKILSNRPDVAGALHGRACVARVAGEPALAIGFAGSAIQIKPEPYYYITLGLALFEQGHAIEAEAALKSAILLNYYDARAHNALGMIYEQGGDFVQAEQSFSKAVELQPDVLVYLVDLTRFYFRRQAIDSALKAAENGVKQNPKNVYFLQELANILYALGYVSKAEFLFKKIVRLCPVDPAAHANLGAALFHLNKLTEAKKHLDYAIQKAPEVVDTQVNFGLVQMALGHLLEAEKVLQTAYKKAPNDQRIGPNLGTVLYELRRLDDAEAIYKQLLDSSSPTVLSEIDRYKVRYNLSTVLLAKGQFKEGWEYMESRLYLLDTLPEQHTIPVWSGDETVKKLLVRAEQGLGDSIQFIRFLPLLLKQCSIVIEVPKTLVRLIEHMLQLQSFKYSWKVIEKGQSMPEGVTHQCGLMSLPYLLNIEEIAQNQYYLPLPELSPNLSNKNLQVGMCWAGNADYRFDQMRSLPTALLSSLLAVPHIEFHSLQNGITKENLPKTINYNLPHGDLLKTAFVIQKLDVVITVDTVIAHLAGALGKEVWLLNRYGGDWRWYTQSGTQAGHSLWYPTMRVFQQKEVLPPDCAWQQVIIEVKEALIYYNTIKRA